MEGDPGEFEMPDGCSKFFFGVSTAAVLQETFFLVEWIQRYPKSFSACPRTFRK